MSRLPSNKKNKKGLKKTEKKTADSKSAKTFDIVNAVDPGIATKITTFLGPADLSRSSRVCKSWRDIIEGKKTINDDKQTDSDIHLRQETLAQLNGLIKEKFIIHAQNIELIHAELRKFNFAPISQYASPPHTEEQLDRLYALLRDKIISFDDIKKACTQNEATRIETFWECFRQKGFPVALREDLLKLPDDLTEERKAVLSTLSKGTVLILIIQTIKPHLMKLIFSDNGLIALRKKWLEARDFFDSTFATYELHFIGTIEKVLTIALSNAGIEAIKAGNLNLNGLKLITRADNNLPDVSRVNSVHDLQELLISMQQIAGNTTETEEQLTP